MNNSGSTMLHYYLEKCCKAASLPQVISGQATSSEGQYIAKRFMPMPGKYNCQAVFTERSDIFSDVSNYNWDKITSIWKDGWLENNDISKDSILIEKSPTNVVRASMLQSIFSKPYFIIMVRNPYAVSEGIRRRHGHPIERCIKHWVKSSIFQIQNIEKLKNNIYIKYEDLCNDQAYVKERIIKYLPELNDLSFNEKFSGHYSIYGSNEMHIKNLNDNQINNLSQRDISIINKHLNENLDVIKYFGYKII